MATADIHTHTFRKCSHASVGIAQARPNDVEHFEVATLLNISENYLLNYYWTFPGRIACLLLDNSRNDTCIY